MPNYIIEVPCKGTDLFDNTNASESVINRNNNQQLNFSLCFSSIQD